MEWIRKRNGELPMQVNTCGEVAYLTFPLLEETGMVDHLFLPDLAEPAREFILP